MHSLKFLMFQMQTDFNLGKYSNFQRKINICLCVYLYLHSFFNWKFFSVSFGFFFFCLSGSKLILRSPRLAAPCHMAEKVILKYYIIQTSGLILHHVNSIETVLLHANFIKVNFPAISGIYFSEIYNVNMIYCYS